MRSEDLIKALGGVDEKFIDEADPSAGEMAVSSGVVSSGAVSSGDDSSGGTGMGWAVLRLDPPDGWIRIKIQLVPNLHKLPIMGKPISICFTLLI